MKGINHTSAQVPRHLLVRVDDEPLKATRYHALCGRSGVTKRQYTKEALLVDCPECKAKLQRFGC